MRLDYNCLQNFNANNSFVSHWRPTVYHSTSWNVGRDDATLLFLYSQNCYLIPLSVILINANAYLSFYGISPHVLLCISTGFIYLICICYTKWLMKKKYQYTLGFRYTKQLLWRIFIKLFLSSGSNKVFIQVCELTNKGQTMHS